MQPDYDKWRYIKEKFKIAMGKIKFKYILGPIVLVFIIEAFDQILQSKGIALPFPFPFLDILIVIGTLSTVFVALQQPYAIRELEKHNEREKLINNLKNEIFINFDQLQENGLKNRDFIMEIRQLDILLDNSRFINLEAEGIFRPLKVFYTTAKRFNEKIKTMITDSDVLWKEIKLDCINHMLQIFHLCNEMSSDEVEKSITTIGNFCSRDKLEIEDFDELKNELPERFWKLNEFKFTIKNVNESVDFDGMRKNLLRKDPGHTYLLEQKRIVLNFLIERLANLENLKKERMKKNLDKNIRSLVKED